MIDRKKGVHFSGKGWCEKCTGVKQQRKRRLKKTRQKLKCQYYEIYFTIYGYRLLFFLLSDYWNICYQIGEFVSRTQSIRYRKQKKTIGCPALDMTTVNNRLSIILHAFFKCGGSLSTKFFHLLKEKNTNSDSYVKSNKIYILLNEIFFLLYPNGSISEVAYTVFWFCAYRPIKAL